MNAIPTTCRRRAKAAMAEGSQLTSSTVKRGFALVWWALFIGLAAFPLLVFVVEGARYMQAAGAVQKSS